MASDIVLFDDRIEGWQKAFYAFLAEKERRSGSRRTVDAYSRTLQRFFGTLGKSTPTSSLRRKPQLSGGRKSNGRRDAEPSSSFRKSRTRYRTR